MPPFFRFDIRTLEAFISITIAMFAVVIFWMNRVYPQLRGLQSTALAYLLAIPCGLLFFARGYAPVWLSIVVANFLVLVCNLLLYDGIVRFVGARPKLFLPVTASVASMLVLIYWSEIRSSIMPQIIAVNLAVAFMRSLVAWELLRQSSKPAKRVDSKGLARIRNQSITRSFGILVASEAALYVLRAVYVCIYGMPNENINQTSNLYTLTAVAGVIYVIVDGLFYLIMVGNEMILSHLDASERDEHSNIFNRRGIEARLAGELKRSRRTGQKLSIAIGDIDYFKEINDSLGHAAGDAAIRTVAQAISQALRESDYLGRLGGDEFLIVLPNTASEQAEAIGARLLHVVSTVGLQDWTERITLSVGIAEAAVGDDASILLKRADDALYKAKRGGRNCVRTPANGAASLVANPPESHSWSPQRLP